MIEATGPYGLDYKRTVPIKVLNYLSDGEWHTSDEISMNIGVKKSDVINVITSKYSGLIISHHIESRHIDDPNDSHRMITEYRYKLILRPCFWCNQSPYIHKTRTRITKYSIRCRCGIETIQFDNEPDAVRKWNTRYGE